MSERSGASSEVRAVAFLVMLTAGAWAPPTFAQAQSAPSAPRVDQSPATPPQEGHQHPAPAPDHSQHHVADLFDARDASGTAWLPESTPMYGIHQQAGRWQVMWHGTAFAAVNECGLARK